MPSRYAHSSSVNRANLRFAIVLLRFDTLLAPTLAAAFLALLLRFALVNHRSAERAGRRLWTQGLWVAACLTAEVILAGLVAP